MKRFAVLVAVAILVLPAFVLAAEPTKVTFPDTPAGRLVAGYVEAFNSDAPGALRAFLEANLSSGAIAQRPVEQRLKGLQQLKADAGTLAPMKIVEAREDALTIIAQGSKGSWLEISFAFEAGASVKMIGGRFVLLDEPPDLSEPNTPLTETELLAEIDSFIDGLVAKDDFSGVILVARGESPLFWKAHGFASREYGALNRIDTRFNLGSINKVVTRVAIEQLAGKGALALDDTIGKFLPDYPNKDAAEKVTIRRLLDMTSGIGDFFGEKFDATPKDRIRDLADYLPLFAAEPLLFEPGTDNRYSNGGYVVLGLIVEKASGMSYFDYVRENIYKPAGMENTDHFMADMFVDNLASGYTRNWDDKEHPNEPRRNNIYTRPARGSSAGGGYSTADDLLRLVLALKADRLSAPETARIFAGNMAFAGGAPGINAYVETIATTGCTVVVLANYDPPAAGKTGEKIGRLLKRLK
ncbi:MAG: serine hydrolase domain-containing protein [Candidatus Krumholzibacteriia bacterium]